MMELEKYLKAIEKAADVLYSKIEAALMTSDEQDEQLRNEAYRLSKEGVDEQRQKITDKFNADIESARAEFNAVLEKQEAGFMNEVDSFYTPDGSRIDLNEMNLLKSGLLLSLDEIYRKILQNRDNATMLLLYEQYVRENRISLEGDLGAQISGILRRVSMRGAAEKSAFKSFVGKSTVGLQHPDKTYVYVQRKLVDYELEAEIRILEARPIIDDDVLSQIGALETEITKLEEARGFKRKPEASRKPERAPAYPAYWGAGMARQ